MLILFTLDYLDLVELKIILDGIRANTEVKSYGDKINGLLTVVLKSFSTSRFTLFWNSLDNLLLCKDQLWHFVCLMWLGLSWVNNSEKYFHKQNLDEINVYSETLKPNFGQII